MSELKNLEYQVEVIKRYVRSIINILCSHDREKGNLPNLEQAEHVIYNLRTLKHKIKEIVITKETKKERNERIDKSIQTINELHTYFDVEKSVIQSNDLENNVNFIISRLNGMKKIV